MYALFVLSVHVYYVNCNDKTQMGYMCELIKYTNVFLLVYNLLPVRFTFITVFSENGCIWTNALTVLVIKFSVEKN
jgi:hypothetical protein